MSTSRRERGVAAHCEARRARRAQFLSLHDFTLGRGLEIGPLDSSIADPEADDVRFTDVFDTEGIREHYAADPNVILELIPEVDFPLYQDGRIRSLVEAAAGGGPYDWVIASHVIEHVPDLIGWLGELAELTLDGGALVLAVPDRRYCFDRHRPPTTTGQVIEAHEDGHVRPGIRAVYDSFTAAVTVNTTALWRGKPPPGREARMHTRPAVDNVLERARAGEYVDCHVWTFTPEDFLDQVAELRGLGLCDWYVETIVPVIGGLEFHAVLRRLPRERSNAPVVEPETASDMPGWLHQEWVAQEELLQLRKKVARLRRRNRALSDKLEAVEGSRRMRIGSAVVAPVAAIRRLIPGRAGPRSIPRDPEDVT